MPQTVVVANPVPETDRWDTGKCELFQKRLLREEDVDQLPQLVGRIGTQEERSLDRFSFPA